MYADVSRVKRINVLYTFLKLLSLNWRSPIAEGFGLHNFITPVIFFQPERLVPNTGNSDASTLYSHVKRKFARFLDTNNDLTVDTRLDILFNHAMIKVYQSFESATSYDEMMGILDNVYIKQNSSIFNLHKLFLCHQADGQSIDQFTLTLQVSSRDREF
ncbi:hypothetical protein GJ496_001793 [Pomphorhynchus laevis]|nr:hypothetical protein GJ496_001793 [Pomphorhynchus laevis]